MSLHAISWALKQPVRKSTEKFVLVCLANYCNEQGMCYPSIAALEQDTAQDRKTIIRSLQQLIASGWIADTGERTGTTKQIPIYQILLVNSTQPGNVRRRSKGTKSGTLEGVENSPESGTVPEAEQSRISAETVPFFPENSTVFPPKQSQKRYTEPKGTSKEPSGNKKRVALPAWMPLDAWQGFLDMRRQARKTPTTRAIELLIARLAKLREEGHDPAEVLDRSTSGNWSGLFPLAEQQPRNRAASATPPPTGKYSATIAALTGRDRQKPPDTIDVAASEVQPRRLG